MPVPETTLSTRMSKCAAHVLQNMPGFILNQEFRKRVGLLRAKLIEDPSDKSKGWASVDGSITLNVAQLARFCHDSPYSRWRGKSDLTPTGVACHEVGHIVHIRLLREGRQDLNNRIKQLWTTDRKHAITSYARTLPREDFAEAHRLWATNPGLLKELSPERWELQSEVYLYLLGQRRSGYKIRTSTRPTLFLQLFEVQDDRTTAPTP